jgi:predicted nucleotidyltransferase
MPEAEIDPVRALANAAEALRQHSIPFALVGGLAVSTRAEPRFTKDVDLAIVVADDRQFEQLVYQLRAAGFMLRQQLNQVGDGRLATVRLVSAHGWVDLLAANSGIEREIVDRAELIDVPGAGAIPVARVEELVAMKLLSVKPQRPLDQVDLENLIAINPNLDFDRVRELLRIITDRGYSRDQDLFAKLEALLVEVGLLGSE